MAEQLLVFPWRDYPAAVLALLGAGLVAAGVLKAWGDCRRQQSGLAWAFTYLYVFRRVVVGLALIGAGAAWYWQAPGLFAAAVCIGIGELLETTYYLEVLRWGQRRRVAWLVSDG
jgi:hypothetical protein